MKIKEIPKINITTSIPCDLHTDAQELNISWNEALILGLKIILKDLDVYEQYPQCPLSIKLANLLQIIENQQKEIEALKELNKITSI
jgi:hypothetical protein